MKPAFFIVVPLAGLAVMTTVLAVSGAPAGWSVGPGPLYVALATLAVAASAGLAVGQTRITLLSLLFGAVALLLDRHFFVAHDDPAGAATVLLATMSVPLVAAVLHHLPERGLLDGEGTPRLVVAAIGLTAVVLLPLVPSFGRSVCQSGAWLLGPADPWLPLPRLGIIVTAVSLVALAGPARHESPALGPLVSIALVYFILGLGCRSSLWQETSQRAAMLLLMTGGGFTLAWSVVEGAWRGATVDELTGLGTRRMCRKHLARIASEPCAIAMIDIDHFKKINDGYGHRTGDEALKCVASEVRAAAEGMAYRYGGEEFMVILEGVKQADAVEAMEKLRSSIEDRKFIVRSRNRPRRKPARGSQHPEAGTERITITVSIGVASLGRRHASAADAVEAADAALYKAKKAGRNRVESAS